MNKPLSVTELNNQLKSLLESTFTHVYVEGEVSNLTYHGSGHIYFSIKDQNSTISCVMFRGNASKLRFRLEVGQKVIINGSITVYTPRGNYQLLCTNIEPSGIGGLALAYEQLKAKLQIKGYFDTSIKKQLPKFPKHITIVTSSTGAAIEDMKKILANRWPLAKITLISSLVQGEGAKEDIAKSIKIADSLNSDVMIVARGGGSIEDLWPFNEEMVADAIYEANTPVVSAVGHESDFVISDFVADVRASTPSNAIETITPDINEFKIYIDTLIDDLNRRFLVLVSKKEETLKHMSKVFEQYSFASKFKAIENEIKNMKLNLNNSFKHSLAKKENELNLLYRSYDLNNPEKKSRPGYAQVTKDDKVIDLKNLNIGDEFFLENPVVVVKSKVLDIKTINP